MFRFVRLHAITFVVLSTGCGGSAPTGNYDADRARETLVAALDAWKQGRVGELTKRQPPIRFADDDLRSGCRLLEYKLAEPGDLVVEYQNVSVTLSLRDRHGKTTEKPVTYQVTLLPALAVMRSD